MPTVFTCKCGGQAWTLYSNTDIKCDSCKRCYTLSRSIPELNRHVIAAEEFNEHREQLVT